MQKDLIPVINCLLCLMNWYSWGVIRSSLRIHTHSLRICTVVKFYNHTLRQRYGCIPMQYSPPFVLLERKQGGHKPVKHGKPGKLSEFEKLSKSQGKLKEI